MFGHAHLLLHLVKPPAGGHTVATVTTAEIHRRQTQAVMIIHLIGIGTSASQRDRPRVLNLDLLPVDTQHSAERPAAAERTDSCVVQRGGSELYVDDETDRQVAGGNGCS